MERGLTGDQGDALEMLQVWLARKDKRRSQLFCSIEVDFCPSHPVVVVRVAAGRFTQKWGCRISQNANSAIVVTGELGR